jgi:uncharacterized membrane protein YdjX (TVP38/TMEM64 family)
MKTYWLLVCGILMVFLLLFLVLEALEIPLLTEPKHLMSGHAGLVAITGVALLCADILLPVPSSLVMIAHGAVFGIVVGTLLSLVGSVGAALIGFLIGRHSDGLLNRFMSNQERAQSNQLLDKWGIYAIIVTRPIPLLAETTILLAGASNISWWQMLFAALVGSLPPALLFAISGATAVNLDHGVLSFGIVLLIAGCFWILGRRFHRQLDVYPADL